MPMRRVGELAYMAPSTAPTSAEPNSVPNAAPNRAPTTLRISSERLFAGAAEVQIEHRGSLYRLKQTSLGKLILTK